MIDCLAVTDSYYIRITVINERSKSKQQVTAASATSFYILKNFQEPTTYLEAIQGDLDRLWLLLAGAQQGPFRVFSHHRYSIKEYRSFQSGRRN